MIQRTLKRKLKLFGTKSKKTHNVSDCAENMLLLTLQLGPTVHASLFTTSLTMKMSMSIASFGESSSTDGITALFAAFSLLISSVIELSTTSFPSELLSTTLVKIKHDSPSRWWEKLAESRWIRIHSSTHFSINLFVSSDCDLTLTSL